MSFYGGKDRTINLYPPPRYDRIIEPFAGGASYARRYYNRKITLVERSPKIVGVWKYLLRTSGEEILRLPLLEPNQDVQDLKIPEEAQWLPEDSSEEER